MLLFHLIPFSSWYQVYTGTPPYVLLGGLGVQEDRYSVHTLLCSGPLVLA